MEVANILRRAVAFDDISADSAALAHADLLNLRVQLFAYEPFAPRVWELRHNLVAYDAWYVAIAEALNVPLATLDRRLASASEARCSFATPTVSYAHRPCFAMARRSGVMVFVLDGFPRVETVAFQDCGGAHDAVTGFVLRDGHPHAVYFFVWWYPHPGEAYIDVVLSSSGVDDALDDAVMFGCRIGHVASHSAPAASLVETGTRVAPGPQWV